MFAKVASTAEKDTELISSPGFSVNQLCESRPVTSTLDPPSRELR